MRPNQSNKRSRGRGNNNNNNGRKNFNPLTRSYDSNGPEVRVRGTAQTVADKYTQLARDAHTSGDSVAAENFLQHAEHYNRIISAAQAQQQSRNEANEQRREVTEAENAPAPEAEAVSENKIVEAQPATDVAEVAPQEAKPKPERARRERRPRRTTRKEEAPVVAQTADEKSAPEAEVIKREAPVEAAPSAPVEAAVEAPVAADPAKSPQPALDDLPAFVTGEPVTAAE